jgi:hypothetical protein
LILRNATIGPANFKAEAKMRSAVHTDGIATKGGLGKAEKFTLYNERLGAHSAAWNGLSGHRGTGRSHFTCQISNQVHAEH